MVYWKHWCQATFYQDNSIDKEIKKEKSSKRFVRPIITGIIGGFNCIGTSLNG